MITPYSIVSAILWSNIFIILLYLVRKKRIVLNLVGTVPLVLMAAVCILRLFVCFDLPFTQCIISYRWVANFVDGLTSPIFSVGAFGFSIVRIALAVWLIGALISGSIAIFSSIRAQAQCFCKNVPAESAVVVLADEFFEQEKKPGIKICRNPYISEPMVYDVFHPTIVLPMYDIDAAELPFVLAHEIYHITHHDLQIKLGAEILKTVFWWNPCSWLFAKELNHILELRNDGELIEGRAEVYRCDYASAIVSIAKKANAYCGNEVSGYGMYCGFVSKKKSEVVSQRVNLVMNYRQRSKVNVAVTYLLIVALFLASHAVVIQPGWQPDPEKYGETFSMDEETIANSYFIEKENGMYQLIVNGQDFGEVVLEEAQNPPFDRLRVVKE